MAPIFRQTKPQKPQENNDERNSSSPSRFTTPAGAQQPRKNFETNLPPKESTPMKDFRKEKIPDISSSNSTLLGKGQLFNGEISGKGSLRVEGDFVGTIKIEDEVIIGKSGKVKGDIISKEVTVIGEIKGNVEALEKINIEVDGSMIGDIVAPRVMVEEGAVYKGRIDMEPKSSKKKPLDDSQKNAEVKPAQKQRQAPNTEKSEKTLSDKNENKPKETGPVEGPPPKPNHA